MKIHTLTNAIAAEIFIGILAWGIPIAHGDVWRPGGPSPSPLPDFSGGIREMQRINEVFPPPSTEIISDERGNISRAENPTDAEITLKNGLILGPKTSIDLREGMKIITGYLIHDDILYTSKGSVTNLSDHERRLHLNKGVITLGPSTALNSEGKLLAGYVIVEGRKYLSGGPIGAMGRDGASPQGVVAVVQYITRPRSSDEAAAVGAFEALIKAYRSRNWHEVKVRIADDAVFESPERTKGVPAVSKTAYGEVIGPVLADLQRLEVKNAKLVIVSPTRAQITGALTLVVANKQPFRSTHLWELEKRGDRWLLVRGTLNGL